jgi:hypothetical protein
VIWLLAGGFILLLAVCGVIQYAYGSRRMKRGSAGIGRGVGFEPPDGFEKPPNEGDLL